MNKPDYISLPDFEILKKKFQNNLEPALKKLESGYPIQYLIGNVDFLNVNILVNESVLIPRFETEHLVGKTIDYVKNKFLNKIDIVDLGTGSGCIAIALKKNLDANVTAIDISADALKIAKENALRNNVKVNFIETSMENKLDKKYDVIISNPPYIPYDGYVQDKVRDNEPALALFADANGLYFYKVILEKHLDNLKKPGLIAFEIGDNQEQDLEKLLKEYPKLKWQFEKDLQGLTRYLFIFNE